MAVDPPTVPNFGFWTEAEIRSIPEYLGGFTNRAGIPDTKEGLRTRANASWPRLVVEMMVCLNAIMRGDKIVPGIPDVGSTSTKRWRPGDDEANVVELADLTFYSVPLPAVLWGLNADRVSEAGAQVINVDSNDSNRMLWEAETHRGGVSDTSAGLKTYALRGTGDMNYFAAAAVTGMDTAGELTVCGTFNLPQWHQANDGVILLAHRMFNSADEDGTPGVNLGFEIGLGDPDFGGVNQNDLALYYRGGDGDFLIQDAVAVVGGQGSSQGRLYLPWNREHHIAVQRYNSGGWRVRFVVNGIEVSDVPWGTGANPTPGNSPDMRIVFGSNWNGLQHMGGGMRNVMVWPAGTTQPTVAHLQTVYRVGAGFADKAP
jgi:hypothetical protein